MGAQNLNYKRFKFGILTMTLMITLLMSGKLLAQDEPVNLIAQDWCSNAEDAGDGDGNEGGLCHNTVVGYRQNGTDPRVVFIAQESQATNNGGVLYFQGALDMEHLFEVGNAPTTDIYATVMYESFQNYKFRCGFQGPGGFVKLYDHTSGEWEEDIFDYTGDMAMATHGSTTCNKSYMYNTSFPAGCGSTSDAVNTHSARIFIYFPQIVCDDGAGNITEYTSANGCPAGSSPIGNGGTSEQGQPSYYNLTDTGDAAGAFSPYKILAYTVGSPTAGDFSAIYNYHDMIDNSSASRIIVEDPGVAQIVPEYMDLLNLFTADGNGVLTPKPAAELGPGMCGRSMASHMTSTGIPSASIQNAAGTLLTSLGGLTTANIEENVVPIIQGYCGDPSFDTEQSCTANGHAWTGGWLGVQDSDDSVCCGNGGEGGGGDDEGGNDDGGGEAYSYCFHPTYQCKANHVCVGPDGDNDRCPSYGTCVDTREPGWNAEAERWTFGDGSIHYKAYFLEADFIAAGYGVTVGSDNNVREVIDSQGNITYNTCEIKHAGMIREGICEVGGEPQENITTDALCATAGGSWSHSMYNISGTLSEDGSGDTGLNCGTQVPGTSATEALAKVYYPTDQYSNYMQNVPWYANVNASCVTDGSDDFWQAWCTNLGTINNTTAEFIENSYGSTRCISNGGAVDGSILYGSNFNYGGSPDFQYGCSNGNYYYDGCFNAAGEQQWSYYTQNMCESNSFFWVDEATQCANAGSGAYYVTEGQGCNSVGGSLEVMGKCTFPDYTDASSCSANPNGVAGVCKVDYVNVPNINEAGCNATANAQWKEFNWNLGTYKGLGENRNNGACSDGGHACASLYADYTNWICAENPY